MLKKPCVAKRKDSKVRTKSRSNRIWQEVTVAEGSLWYLKKLSSEVLKSLSRSSSKESTPPTSPSISLGSYEYEGTILQCGIEVVIPLQNQEYTIFQAISQPSQRTQVRYVTITLIKVDIIFLHIYMSYIYIYSCKIFYYPIILISN